MARKLPWLAPSSTSSKTKTPTPSKSGPRKRPANELANISDSGSDLTIPSSTNKASPPPQAEPSSSPIQPIESEMQTGFDADDAWIMVEDEFLSTAHLFTARLHREEYHRRAELARERGSSRAHTFHTDLGRTQQSGLTNAKTKGLEMRKKRKMAMKNIFGVTRARDMDEEDETRDGYNLDPKLSELMADRKSEQVVIKPVLHSSPTRPSRYEVNKNGGGSDQKIMRRDKFIDANDNTAIYSDEDQDITEIEPSPLRKPHSKISPHQRLIKSVVDGQREPISPNPTTFVIKEHSGSPITLPTSKRAAMNPKIQQLLAKRKAEAAAAAQAGS